MTRGVRGAACGRERVERRIFFGRGLLGRLGPSLEYGAVRRFPMRAEVASSDQPGLPQGTTWCEAFGVHANWGCRMHGRCGKRRA